MNKKRMTGILLWTALVSLSGCKSNVLDYRNAEINNGKVYASGANEPFTGKVTNFPAKGFLTSQDGRSLVMRTLSAALPKNKGYLGALYSWDNSCDVHVQDGVQDGEAICKPPQSDVPLYQVSFNKGAVDSLQFFDGTPDKNNVTTIGFKNGLPDGKQEVYSPKTHKLVYRTTWANGVLDGDEAGFDEDTGNQTLVARLDHGKYDGDFIQYGPDGKQLLYKVTFIQGAKNGIEQQFYPDTGKPLLYVEWSSGQKNGVSKVWKTNGELDTEEEFRNGLSVRFTSAYDRQQASKNVAAGSNSTTDQCVDSWQAAFRKEKGGGDDVIVTSDQINEWADWCKAGKRPNS